VTSRTKRSSSALGGTSSLYIFQRFLNEEEDKEEGWQEIVGMDALVKKIIIYREGLRDIGGVNHLSMLSVEIMGK
jgi:hypothetical protein